MATTERDSRSRYEIVLQARLGSRSGRLFDGFEREEIAGDGMILRGEVADQAALHGVLAQIRDLGIGLVAVRRLPGSPLDDADATSGS